MVPQHPPTTLTPRSDHEAAQVLGQRLGRQVVVHVAVHHRRQPGVGDAGDGHAGVLGQVAQVLAHLDRAGGAVDADEIGLHGVEGRQGRGDLGAGQHAPGQLHRHLHLQGDLATGRRHGLAGPDHRRLDGQQVEEGLDDDDVDAAVEQAPGLHLELVAQGGEADLAQRRELGARPDRSGHEPGMIGGGEAVGRLPGDAGPGQVDLVGPVSHVVLTQSGWKTTEGARLDDVDAHLQEAGVELTDDVGPGDDQHLVAALEGFAPEIVRREVPLLDAGAERAVIDEDAVAHGVEEAGHGSRLVVA